MDRLLNSLRFSLALAAAAILSASALGQTKIYLHDASSSVSGYKTANQALGPSNTTAITNTTTGGTDIQVTKTGGGSTVAWITEPLAAGVTISGTVTCNIYGGESSNSANSAFRCRLYKYSGGSEGAAILTANMTTELSTSTTTVRNWTGSPSSTAFAAGDRIVIKLFVENCQTSGCPTGSMGNGYTVTARYDGPTDGANAASWIQISETADFQWFGDLAESVGAASDSVAAVVGRSASISETVTCSDSLTAAGSTCKPVPLIETYLTTDALDVTPSGDIPRSLSESLSATDSLTISSAHVAGLSEAQTTTDAIVGQRGALRAASESVTADDAIARLTGKGSPVSESLSTSDAVTWTSAHVAGISESLSVTDSLTAVGIFHRTASLSEAVTVSDSCTANKSGGGGGGTCFPVPLIETHVTNDSVVTFRPQFQRTIVEVIATSDAVTAVKVIGGGLAEGFTTLDSVTVVKCDALHENLSTVDALSALRGRSVLLSETLSLTDAVSRSVGRLLLEQLTTSDSLLAQRPTTFSLNIGDIFSTGDSLATVRTMHGGLSEATSTADAVAVQRSMYRTVGESSFADDSVAHQADFVAALPESLEMLDQLTAQTVGHASLSFSDALVLTDSVARAASLGKGISEAVSVADAVAAARGPVLSFNEVLVEVDYLTVARTRHVFSLLSEARAVSDSLTLVAPRKVIFSESFVVTDDVVVRIGRRRFMLIEVP